MRENGLDRSAGRRIPVYQNRLNIGHISYHELMAFLAREEDGRNIYTQKLLFDLGSALAVIRDTRSKARKQTGRTLKTFAFVAMAVIALLVLDWTYRNGKASSGVSTDREADGSQFANRTVKTPKGKRYHIRLPDGSHVWLNSASEISYPARFTGGRRVVFLTGEAYFEVVKVKATRPVSFIVKTNKQHIEVLGTRFNVNAYADEECTKTMLLEGSVRVSPLSSSGTGSGHASDANIQEPAEPGATTQSVVLKPNQQSILTDSNHIAVVEADPETVVAWRAGEYSFSKEPLESIMRVLARWHNIEVVYQDDNAGKQIFGGSISSSWDLMQALNILELTHAVSFKVEGNRVIVSEYRPGRDH